ncbi:LuxR C-terminal-related transcriptional regulator [Geodermatophilus obscurus]|uniref:ATP-dependent transcriptional regulator, MalT-like, LuxR family n=1 Tax=Geodermatophilus obscurus (strain ATCC 25078 / DSM 43160 / JCM 3152 / CCUG 61914 / KCC A-0152 / KCTC 9177 / NBRC 13315 / NRRL B-3577 / G-20) TaxID=526225 RepID=D2S7N2_GEOOG|nr:LuxR C-terminal-related transcriptional regulator [Geodermatophilus obscurus]ADB75491.1 ATP-dependent transcriptional regulator, MalT- like, LuxR family [Geodermatophilus obscurus DSM 43160]
MSGPTGAGGPLLAGKLTVPQVPPSLVPRPRLQHRLDAVRRTPVTVVAAGAGYGKSTLLAAWARHAGMPVAWVTLGSSEDDPARFWTYVATALAGSTPDVAGPALRALTVPSVDPLDVAVPELLNGFAARDEPTVLVLDDLHEVTDARVTEGLEFLLDHLPPALRVVLASRTEPPIGLARLRARGRLTELVAADLRFTVQEARALLTSVVHGGPDDPGPEPAALAGLLARTEGWAAGLVLGALTLRDRAHGRAVPHGPPGLRSAVDFLLAEVLAGQTPDRRELLLRSAPLDRLCGPLCDAVLGRADSGAVLAGLERDGVFVTAVDGDGRWYRVHPLFRAALRRELDDPAGVAEVQRRAAVWFWEQGLVEEAIRARLGAGDSAGAADWLVRSTGTFLATARVGVFAELGNRLDPAVVADSVPLLLSLAWAAGVTGRLDRVPALLDRAAAQARAGRPGAGFPGFAGAVGAIAALRAVYGTTAEASPEVALAAAHEAVAAETDPELPGWVVARVALGGALLTAGREAEALAALDAAWQAPAASALPVFSHLEVAGLLAWCLVQPGDDDPDPDRDARAERLLRSTRADAAALEAHLGDAAAAALALLHAAAGVLDRRAGRLGSARAHSDRAAVLVEVQAHPAVAVLVLVSAAETALAAGDPTAALEFLDRAREARLSAPPSPILDRQIAAVELRAGRRAATRVRPALLEPLTEREVSVLRALRGPLSQREVGAALHLSINTVKSYTRSLYRKLDVGSRREAVERGRALGLC